MKKMNKVMLLVGVSATLLSGCSNAIPSIEYEYTNARIAPIAPTSMFDQFTIDKENDARKQEAERSFKKHHQMQDIKNAKVNDEILMTSRLIELKSQSINNDLKAFMAKSRLCMTSALCDKRSEYLKGLGY